MSTDMLVGRIIKVSGPLVVAEGMAGAKMYDVVRVSDKRLIGEIIEMRGDRASIQVYEETFGLGPGEPVYSTGEPLSVELGPGLISSIYDGIQRPLEKIYEKVGDRIERGVEAHGLDHDRKWSFAACVKPGDRVVQGDIIGTVEETKVVEHRVMVPFGIGGTVTSIESGDFTVTERIATIKADDGEEHCVSMMQRWPVRKGRNIMQKLSPDQPLISGQRVIDTFFPVAKGGTACVPGPFGSGKTVVQHQLAKWADADIIVYVGCGERGNEMTEVLTSFPELTDPKSGKPLMNRTVLIANTSNMPVAAREASVYTGMTIAEYFRDMGLNVSLMADSSSRWAEAMREISSRLEEMPGEEGYPAYLSARLSEFYERAGRVVSLSGGTGSISVVGAVSPPGGDLSEPVTQNTLRIVRVFWALDTKLRERRHFPAINWLTSYSLYSGQLDGWYKKNVAEDFPELRNWAIGLLQKESELQEIVQLVGSDALPDEQKLTLEISRMIREIFLQQNAYHPIDTYSPMSRQYTYLRLINRFAAAAAKAVENEVSVEAIANMDLRNRLAKSKFEENIEEELKAIADTMDKEFEALGGK